MQQMNMQDPLDSVVSFLKETDQLKTGSILLQAFKKYSNSLEQFDQLGRLFHDVKDYQNSLECAQKAYELCKTPMDQYATRSNLAKLYNHMNEPQKSIECSEENLRVNPKEYEAKMEILFSHYLASNFTESRKILEELLADPDAPESVRGRCEFNQGTYLLDDGNFKEGILGFIDVGHRIGIWKKEAYLPFKQWQGEVISNQTILIAAEGGIGDEIINIRFAKNIEQLGMKPIFYTTRKNIVDLFKRNGFEVVDNLYRVPQDALYVKAMYLPIALDLDKHDLWTEPYLKPNPEHVEKWKKILPEGKKIALRWQGNPYYDQDLHRTVPLTTLNEVLNFSRDDVTFVSVQKDNFEGIEKYSKILNVADKLETLEDLLACLSLMNYTITSCTSVAHVCAAAGLPLTVCPPVATYYTWLGDAKWYGDNCKILRQRKWRDWSHLTQLKEHANL